MVNTNESTPVYQPFLPDLPEPEGLALRKAQYRELDRLLNAWQRATGREFDDPSHLDADTVIRRARRALVDNSATPYEIVLFTLAELFRGPDDGTLERLEAGDG